MKLYSDNSYYYATGKKYGKISGQNWMFTYAMNWVSQINLYHHYFHCRVIYVTGATGVGKSTEIPKLLYYCTHMLDYKTNGKAICTIPRTDPVSEVAENVSKNMSVPIFELNPVYGKNIPTNNFVIQFKHQKASHISKSQESFLRFVTDGTLLAEMKKSPFLTNSTNSNPDIPWIKEYKSRNIYDLVIVDEAHEHNTNMDLILTLMQNIAYMNNSLKLVIISATMEDDEQIYRRFYRKINDNRAYPLNSFIQENNLDRANMDRRVDISKPRETTQFKIDDYFLDKKTSDEINEDNYVEKSIEKTIEVLNKTARGHLLLFLAGKNDIKKAVEKINKNTSSHIIAFPYHSELTNEQKNFIQKINDFLPGYTKSKYNETDIVSPNTYTRAVIIATNVAEASITITGLRYVVDSGYAKVLVYNPITQVEELITIPISYTSSRQRRGRVGRTAPGSVYYMYDEAKVINNKTSYKIADENILDNLVDLLKTEPSDYPIITDENNVNNIQKLVEFKNNLSYGQYLLYDLFRNVNIYYDIIIKNYMLMSESNNMLDYEKFYWYYGKGDIKDHNISYYQTKEYLINNHDDYHYAKDDEIKFMCHTGFDSDILRDPASDLDFYIIHPDENVIHRKLHTGKMTGIKKSQSVSDEYYFSLFAENNLLNVIDFKRINFNNFKLLKYDLFIELAKSLSLVIELDTQLFDLPSIKFHNVTDEIIRNRLIEYYKYINTNYENNTHIIRTPTAINIELAKSIVSRKIPPLDNRNNLLWYLYSIPYNLHNDVLALCCMMNIDTTFRKWTKKYVPTIKYFLDIKQNPKGDIHFFWIVWTHIKKELIKNNLLNKFDINIIKNEYNKLKNNYINKIKMNQFDKYLIIDHMYKLGILQDNIYEYLKLTSIKPDDIEDLYKDKIELISEYISGKLSVEKNIIYEFIVTYLVMNYETDKYFWMYNYEIENGLNENDNDTNVVNWFTKKFNMNRILKGDDIWYTILETYIRSHSSNLLRSLSNVYIVANTGNIFGKAEWSMMLDSEPTFLNSKTKYIVYHEENNSNARYLTPVQLDWVVKLNPIYYFYFIKNKKDFLEKFDKSHYYIEQIKKIVLDIENAFDQNQLLYYINQMDDKIMTKVIMNDLRKY